jgi:hypothetical protein
MKWSNLLDSFGRNILFRLGESPDYLPTDRNPITEALKRSDFLERFEDLEAIQPIPAHVISCRVSARAAR